MTRTPSSGTPEITVLMACFNASRWLDDAVKSILVQTFQNFEFILVDDGSTDETWRTIQRFSDQDARIVAISKQHSGLADSLNFGISRARGAWIARLDADDWSEPSRLERQINFVRRHPHVLLLGSGSEEVDARGRTIKKNLYPSRHTRLVRHLERLQRFFPHSSAILKTEMAQKVGCYNARFPKTQDWDLWLRVAEQGTIACLDDCLVKIRMHAGQVSHSRSGTSQLIYGMVASTCHYLRLNGYPDPSSIDNESAWNGLIAWITRRVTEEGISERRESWSEARAKFFATQNSVVGAVQFGAHLLNSGYATSLLRERFRGYSLPQRLAHEWMTARN